MIAARILSACLIVVATSIAGCLWRATQPTQFYVLTSLSEDHRATPMPGDRRDLGIGVGPVELPRYLDRPQMVIRMSGNALAMAEFDQWAEPLQESVIRILAENLSLLLATDYVATFPWPRAARLEYQVTVNVTQFEAGPDGEVRLAARWAVFEAGGKEELLRNTFTVRLPLESSDYATIVRTMSQSLAALSQDIAVALRASAQSRAGGQGKS